MRASAWAMARMPAGTDRGEPSNLRMLYPRNPRNPWSNSLRCR
jgi:hypothetical protein